MGYASAGAAGALGRGLLDYAQMFLASDQARRARKAQEEERAYGRSRDTLADARYEQTRREQDEARRFDLARQGFVDAGDPSAIPTQQAGPASAAPVGSLAQGFRAAGAMQQMGPMQEAPQGGAMRSALTESAQRSGPTYRLGGRVFAYDRNADRAAMDREAERTAEARQREAERRAAFEQQKELSRMEHGFRVREIGASRAGVGSAAAAQREETRTLTSAQGLAAAFAREHPNASHADIARWIGNRLPALRGQQHEGVRLALAIEAQSAAAPRQDATANPADARQQLTRDYMRPLHDGLGGVTYPEPDSVFPRVERAVEHMYPGSGRAAAPENAVVDAGRAAQARARAQELQAQGKGRAEILRTLRSEGYDVQ